MCAKSTLMPSRAVAATNPIRTLRRSQKINAISRGSPVCPEKKRSPSELKKASSSVKSFWSGATRGGGTARCVKLMKTARTVTNRAALFIRNGRCAGNYTAIMATATANATTPSFRIRLVFTTGNRSRRRSRTKLLWLASGRCWRHSRGPDSPSVAPDQYRGRAENLGSGSAGDTHLSGPVR